MRLWTFGDSWAEGWGLDPSQKRFGDYVSDYFNCKHFKKGKSGHSLGHIMYDFHKESVNFKPNDVILLIIPPDCRWYTEKKRSISDLSSSINEKEWRKFIKDKSDFWFRYHHNLFMYNIYCISKDYNCKLLMAHNYGDLVINNEFKNLIPNEVFLDQSQSLTKKLGAEDYDNYNTDNDGPPEPLKGKYFIKGDTHPNSEGHKKIAEFFIKKL